MKSLNSTWRDVTRVMRIVAISANNRNKTVGEFHVSSFITERVKERRCCNVWEASRLRCLRKKCRVRTCRKVAGKIDFSQSNMMKWARWETSRYVHIIYLLFTLRPSRDFSRFCFSFVTQQCENSQNKGHEVVKFITCLPRVCVYFVGTSDGRVSFYALSLYFIEIFQFLRKYYRRQIGSGFVRAIPL